MLTSLALRSFQKHLRLDISLQQITTLVGRTDAGKSSVLRALRWVCLNDPPSNLIREGSKRARVILTLEDGVRIKRERTATINSYATHDGKTDKTFKAFGNDVPAPIARLLNVSEDHFQMQMDSPFWLSLSSGSLAKALNDVVDLSLIDEANAAASQLVRSQERDLQLTEERIKRAEEELAALPDATDLADRLEGLQEQSREISKIREQINTLETTLQTARRLAGVIRRGNTRVETAETILGGVSQTFPQLAEIAERAAQLESVLTDAMDAVQRREEGKARLDYLQKELDTFKSCPLCKRPFPHTHKDSSDG